mmetsp:Transcript_1935/g.4629  ORF Transcript_1935/g.4629 Transcript_1935/m.4629 type:complete len:218 (+) Transcript_1935:58-711(+)|eukprot:CAMPEP_0116846358 /NCGR_PEP_ID=MMETSP0418-20121206/13786_1 /TAXON_ID=1158023 /ORGANISM="Astrosyne radiata, Strain 13vi08-1A" /LENGTH=217 /DNA_ID=CAMNT_0004477587 /DNA_START=45 /DNA_END=698 /DNA_ORIENTATION=-
MSDDSMDTVRQAKQALRKEIRAKLRGVDSESLQDQSARVWERLFEWEGYKSARTVGLFLSMPQCEIQTHVVVDHALAHNKTVYVPVVGANFEHADMELVKCPQEPAFYKSWPQNKWNIPEPPPEMPRHVAQPGELDIILVPGLAFDRTGGRLGQGKGYYDRFLARIKGNNQKRPLLVAVGLEPQLVPQVPTTPMDFTMERILVPQESIVVQTKPNES